MDNQVSIDHPLCCGTVPKTHLEELLSLAGNKRTQDIEVFNLNFYVYPKFFSMSIKKK